MMKVFVAIALMFLTTPHTQAADVAVQGELRKVLVQVQKNRIALEDELSKALVALTEIHASGKNLSNIDEEIKTAEVKINDQRSDLEESNLRMEFLNSLISALEKTNDAKKDATKILTDLSQKQIISSLESGFESKLWIFELQLAIAIRDVMEPRENLSEFIQSFIQSSSIQEPRGLGHFLEGRGNYIGGPVAPVSPKGSTN